MTNASIMAPWKYENLMSLFFCLNTYAHANLHVIWGLNNRIRIMPTHICCMPTHKRFTPTHIYKQTSKHTDMHTNTYKQNSTLKVNICYMGNWFLNFYQWTSAQINFLILGTWIFSISKKTNYATFALILILIYLNFKFFII